jgi:hypothetical protein
MKVGKREEKGKKEPVADRSSLRRCRSTAACAIPAARPSQGFQPRLSFAAGMLGRSCAGPGDLADPEGVFEKKE